MSWTDFAKFGDVQRKRKVWLLIIRHAETESRSNRETPTDAEISEAGRAASKEFGRMFSRQFGRPRLVKSSPVKRCVDTAQEFISCFDKSCDPELSSILGSPGCFVADEELAAENFRRYGVERVALRLARGDKLPGMRHIYDGVRMLLSEAIADLETIKGAGVYVTHDAILVPFILHCTRQAVVKANWPGFLEGVGLWRDSDGLFLAWRGRVFNIDRFAQGGAD